MHWHIAEQNRYFQKLVNNFHLEDNDEEEDATGDVHLKPSEDHRDGAELPDEVDHHEEGGDEPAAAPGNVHVLPLLTPLHPHSHSVLEEG